MITVGEKPHSFLSFAKFRFTLRVGSPMVLPSYKGAVFRGAFGNSFKRLVCIAPRSDCSSCSFRERCLYISIFEAPPPQGFIDAAKFSQAPRPYVLNPPLISSQSFRPGETLEFHLVLLGPAIEALPHFIHCFIEMGRRGLERQRGKYELLQVDLIKNGATIPGYESSTHTLTNVAPDSGPKYLPEDDQTTSLTLEFLTPLRLKDKGDLVSRFSFPFFFECLSRRLSVLAACYGDSDHLPNFASLSDAAQDVNVVQTRLRWFDWERYSRKQHAAMKFGGLQGRVRLAGKLRPFMPHLRLGSQVNVGEKTTFGLGRYEIIYDGGVGFSKTANTASASISPQ